MDGGKARFNYEGRSYSMKWTLEGDAFRASGGGAELNGTLSGGVLELKDIMGSGVNLTLTDPSKAAAPSPAEPGVDGRDGEKQPGRHGPQLLCEPRQQQQLGRRVNDAGLSPGGTLKVAAEAAPDADGLYDLGAVDENGLNYDAYDVVLARATP
jgi:hypothetical protein